MAAPRTGERLVSEHYGSTPQDHLIRLFHEVTWAWAAERLAGARVLDFGCGSGEGTAAMARSAASILGVDVAPDAIAHARERNGGANIAYETIDGAVPAPDDSFDAVCSFQVLEHVEDPDAYLAEARRLLRPGGQLLLATPDRRTRLLRWQRPWNRWHVREWDPAGLARLLARHFAEVEVLTMTGRPEVLDLELRRTRRLRWLTLPLTLPVVPRRLRFRGLDLLFRLKAGRSGAGAPPPAQGYGFDESALTIERDGRPSVNLVATAR
jgi:2-polyprenyl-3-methyl-5-hydroxy-6-metoxy-1,4-benzoquinol methylase